MFICWFRKFSDGYLWLSCTGMTVEVFDKKNRYYESQVLFFYSGTLTSNRKRVYDPTQRQARLCVKTIHLASKWFQVQFQWVSQVSFIAFMLGKTSAVKFGWQSIEKLVNLSGADTTRKCSMTIQAFPLISYINRLTDRQAGR